MKSYDFTTLTGEVIVPNNPFYEESRLIWNRAIQKFPIAIVYCYDQSDVSNAICWARRYSVRFRIRSGGHNYEGYSIGDDLLVIDIDRMNKIKILEDENIVRIQGGVSDKKFYEFVSSRGYPFPAGNCPTVKVAGYSLGGGWGYSARYFGLGCDRLLQIEMIDYKGNLIIANKYCNSELFWACRGAGDGNFGVIVSLTFKLPPKSGNVTLVEIYYPNCTRDKLVYIFNVLQKTLRTLDRKITMRTGFYSSKEEGLASYSKGVFHGNVEEALEAIKCFREIEGCEVTTFYSSFLKVMERVGDAYPTSEKFKSPGRFVYREYTIDEVESIIDLIITRPKNSIFTEIGVFYLGGAVSDKCNMDSAFYYRNAKYIMTIQTIWTNNIYKEENIQWLDRRFNYLYSITEGSYVNFPYDRLKDYEREYYGENKERLRVIKSIYDPLNVFNYQQSIM